MAKNLSFAMFKDAEEFKNAIMASQSKDIAKLYEEWADEIEEMAKHYSHKTNASAPLSERYYKELKKQMTETSKLIANDAYSKIKGAMYAVADSVVKDNVEWLSSFGFSKEGLNAAFSYVPDSIVRSLITGHVYDSGWSLSKSIWGDNEDTLKSIYGIMAGGLAKQESIYEIAKKLESFVRPSARKNWNLKDKDGKRIYPKQVDYNAQRLARTLTQHTYQKSFVETTKNNPFIEEYIWHSNGSRVCELCMARDGKHYKKNELPLDHPNGMCIFEPVVAKDMTQQLADWFNSPDGTYPEIDAFAKNFGYEASKTGTVQDFISKYGMSSKSPSSWFNSLTQIQKAEAKALKDKSGLTWNEWYEKNIYNGDGSNLGGKKKVQAFNDMQEKYLKPYGFTKDNMPYDFDDWSHKISYEQASEILKSMGTSWSDPHPYQQLMKFYNKNLTDKSFVMKAASTTKKSTTTKSTIGSKFDSAAWYDAIRKNNLREMERWCKEWLNIISYAERNGVEVYTGSAYANMNKYLRGQISSTRYADEIEQATAALKKASLHEEVIVRRGSDYNMLRELGIDISEANKDKFVGAIVTEKGFLSTSPASGGGFGGDIEYIIKVPQGSQAMYVDTISRHRGEKELLINRGGKYIIENVEFNNYGEVKKIYMTLKNLKSAK